MHNNESGENWMTALHREILERHSSKILLLVFLLSALAFLATVPLPRSDGMLIGSDGIYYYAYVRSLVIDRDIDFANEYARLFPAMDVEKMKTPTGMTSNQFAVGTALLWVPFFLAAHVLSLALNLVGFSMATDGYGYIYQSAVCLGSIVYGWIGMVLTHRITRNVSQDTAIVSAVMVIALSNFCYYLVLEPSMSHMCSFFASALMFFLWLDGRKADNPGPYFVVGLAGGLMGLVRQPDATLMLLPVFDILLSRTEFLEKRKRIVLIGVGFIAVFWVQMYVWFVLNGSPFLSGYFLDGSQGFTWLSPHLFGVLFSTNHGLFFWHPFLAFSCLGLVCVFRRDRVLAALLCAGFLGQTYLIASWSAWGQGDSFGGRMFIALMPIFVIGTAALLNEVKTKRLRVRIFAGIAALLLLWNVLFILQYRLGYISPGGDNTVRELTAGKIEMVGSLLRRVLP